jgi:hypothetical protein
MNRKSFLKTVGLAFGTWFISACSKIGININNSAAPISTETPVSESTEGVVAAEPTEIITEASTQENEENSMANTGKVKIAFVKTPC